jgi:uncharacterized protein YndB with AHSA1/START domain
LDTNRIETTIALRATPNQVWKAITDAKQFGIWFGAEFNGLFTAGVQVAGRLKGTPGHC